MLQEQDFFDNQFRTLKDKYPSLRHLQDYHLFIVLCIKYFFFSESDAAFDPDIILSNLTDGKDDGGIDAIFNDPNSEGNDVIILQCKYYEESKLSASDVAGELYKINETLKKLASNKISEFNEQLVTAYRNATSLQEESGVTRICFFTSYEPKNKREKNKLEKSMQEYFPSYDYDLCCRNDIASQVETCEAGKASVDYDKLLLDRTNNYLTYEDAVIVNVSALSLQELQNRRRNGLLGMNLRYYVRQKAVDDGIKATIERDADNFWYKNNGILIVCDDYSIDGRELKLWGFSIVNGGQTTNRIGNIDIANDFFLQCKVVKAKGKDEREKDDFIHSIAEATNSQKPIKKSDLKANTPEQARLHERLLHEGVYYMTKKGDRPTKQFSQKYQVATLEQVGKICMAGTLQMPGSARSNSQRMYNDDYYYSLFGPDARAGVIADYLKISYYYDNYLKSGLKGQGFDEEFALPMLRNGRTFQFACIGFLCKIVYGVFQYETVSFLFDNTDELKKVLRSMGDMKHLITNKSIPDEEKCFYTIFSAIGGDVLAYCFEAAIDQALRDQRTLAASDYLKSDLNYYKDVLRRLWREYNKQRDLYEGIHMICEK